MNQSIAPALRRQPSLAGRDDLLAAVDSDDELALFAHVHPSAAVRDAAGELAELRNAGDEVLLYQSEVQHDD